MAQYANSSAEVRAYIDRMVRFSGELVPRLSQEDENLTGMVQRLREQEWAQLSRLGWVRACGDNEPMERQQQRMPAPDPSPSVD